MKKIPPEIVECLDTEARMAVLRHAVEILQRSEDIAWLRGFARLCAETRTRKAIERLLAERKQLHGALLACHRAFTGGSPLCCVEAKTLVADLVQDETVRRVAPEAIARLTDRSYR